MPAGSRLVRCTLRDVNGGGVVIVPPEYCTLMQGTNKGVATADETVNWRVNSKKELERMLADLPADDPNRFLYEAGIKEIG